MASPNKAESPAPAASPDPQRTVFLDAKRAILYAETASLPNIKWYGVYIKREDFDYIDEELINMTIQGLRNGEYYVEDTPKRQERGLYISYPVIGFGSTDYRDMAIGVAQARRQEIMEGEATIDRAFVFGDRPPREEVIKIPGLR